MYCKNIKNKARDIVEINQRLALSLKPEIIE
jgi:hypothetical protein